MWPSAWVRLGPDLDPNQMRPPSLLAPALKSRNEPAVNLGRVASDMRHGMLTHGTLTGAQLKTPKAAAIAGIVFSIPLTATFWLFRRSVPADPLEQEEWPATGVNTAALAMNLIPFAGVAFLWFIGVLRDRLGAMEDRFFATVFFGSALLFLAMLFAASAIIGAIIVVASTTEPNELVNSFAFRFSRATA